MKTTLKPYSNKKKFNFPETTLLLLILVCLMAVMTYIIPAGQFDRFINEETGREMVRAGSYHFTERNPTTLMEFCSSIYRGMVKAMDLITLVLVIGGALGIVTRTGAISAGLGKLVKKFSGKENVIIIIMMTAFALCGATFGFSEEAIPFVVILVTVALKMGFDPITGVSMTVVGVYCGYSAGPLNHVNTATAQRIAELPIFSGLTLRVITTIGALVIGILFTIIHAKRYKKLGIDNTELLKQFNVQEERDLTKTDIIILIILAGSIGLLIFGVIKFQWYLAEISGIFFGMGLLVGIIYHKKNLNQMIKDFSAGAMDMTSALILIGISRAILVIMEDGMIMDTFVYWLSLPLQHLNSIFLSWGMYISQGIINFLIPSSTGQAVVVMPILTPLSDLLGITRQTAVLAYQCGDGFWNMITPTHSVMMASLALAKVPFNKWFRFAWKLVAAWSVWVMIILAIATVTNYGPF